MQAYCLKCRSKVEMNNPESVRLKIRRTVTQGVCPNCGSKVFRMRKLLDQQAISMCKSSL